MRVRSWFTLALVVYSVLTTSGHLVAESETPDESCNTGAVIGEMVDRRTLEPDPERVEATAMARIAWRVCPDEVSDECLSAVMYVVYNRARSAGFPSTIESVCNQPDQWSVRDKSLLPSRVVNLALDNLRLWRSGETCTLPCSRETLYFSATDKGLELRSSWSGEVEQFIPYY